MGERWRGGRKEGNAEWGRERAERREREGGNRGGGDHTHPYSSSKSSLLGGGGGRWEMEWEVGPFLPSDTTVARNQFSAKASKTQFHQERPLGTPGT